MCGSSTYGTLGARWVELFAERGRADLAWPSRGGRPDTAAKGAAAPPGRGGSPGRHATARGSRSCAPGARRRQSRAGAALALAALLAATGQARAANECGPPEAGREIVCTPSTYDPADGNIFYSFDASGEDETDGDFTVRLGDGLAIDYDDRERPGDDVWVSPDDPEDRYYAAVWISPGRFGEYAGDVSVHSSADVTSNGQAIFAGHYGTSGALRLEVTGGDIATTGEGSHAIWGYRHPGSDGVLNLDARDLAISTGGDRAYGVYGLHRGDGALNLDARDLAIDTAGVYAYGFIGWHRGEGAQNIAAHDLAITTAGDFAYSVFGAHHGTGALNLDARDLAIDTAGVHAYGVYGLHRGEGALNLDARDLAITTAGDFAYGVLGLHRGEGELNLDARDLAIDTAGVHAYGVSGWHLGEGALNLDARDLAIDTAGGGAHGVGGWHQGEGELNLGAHDLAIDTAGVHAYGVYGLHQGEGALNLDARDLAIDTAGGGAHGVGGWHQGEGELNLGAHDLAIATAGDGAHGVFGQHRGTGEVNLDVGGVSVATAGVGASGIYGNHFAMDGDVAIRVHDGAVSTSGAEAFGVRGFHAGPGALDIDLRGTAVAAAGDGAHGVAIFRSGSGAARIAVDGGSVHAAGPGASGIRIGSLGEDGSVVWASPVGEDGYRAQGVRVNAPVTGGSGGDAAGVFLAGGGRVAIGPAGSVGAASGVAVLAAGEAPKLAVEIDLDERRAGDVVRGAIRNDGGETTVAVNGVVLHQGAGGATGAVAANGAWDVSLAASETVQGRSFAPGDFVETWAPRAAVYEALPGFLLRLGEASPTGRPIARPGSPVRVRISGGRGSYEPERARLGATYDFRRYAVEAGLELALDENLTGSLSLHHVRGTAQVAWPHGGGEIEADGVGAAAGLAWRGADGYYARGRLAATLYEVDVSARRRGGLAGDIEARDQALRIEAGRRLAVGQTVTLAPRAWAARRWLSGGGFTDAVGSRVSLADAAPLTAGAGVWAETAQAFDEGALTLRASADIERALGGAETAAVVSGERLDSQASATRILLGLDATWRKGWHSLGVQLAAASADSQDTEYTARISLGWTF